MQVLKRLFLLPAALVLLAAPGSPPVRAQGGPPPVPTVTAAVPLARRIAQWDEYSGRFEAVNAVDVRPRVSGFIETIHFKDGDTVKKGDLLFTIDQRPFRLAVESATAEIARAKAQVALGENEVERAKPLVKSGAVTPRDLDQRQSALSVARAALQAAEAARKTAELNLEWTEVRAPISGRISDRRVDAGNLVVGGQTGATLLTTIVTLDPIHFTFEISESDHLRYQRLALGNGSRSGVREEGHPVRIRLADEAAYRREGVMDFIDNRLNARAGTIRGRAVVPNPDHILSPGMFARVELFGGEFDALLVPDAAIVSDQARKIVLTVGADNVIVPKLVVLGPLHEGLRVIKGGLAPHDRVVIDGLASPLVRPGAKVAPVAGEIKMAAK